jgi:hypothetical protein
MKKLFTRIECQEQNHCEAQKAEIQIFFESFINQSTILWRLVRWARIKSHQLKKISEMSNLMQRNVNNNIIKIASNFDEKMNMLIKQFFSNTKQIDLNNTLTYHYSNVVIELKKIISENEIR